MAELDDLLADLDSVQIGGGGVRLPSDWNEPRKETTVAKRHDERGVERLLEQLEQKQETVVATVPHMDPVNVSNAGNCGVCRTVIVDRNYATAAGNNYHESCFLCSKCRAKIVGSCDLVNDRLVCERCVDLAVCRRCAGTISSTQKFVSPSDDTKYHSGTCTTCGKCRSKLNLDEIFFLKGDLFCRDCAETIIE